jgi:2-methylcitrate dehydratase PrpD
MSIISEIGGKKEATTIGHAFQTSCVNAALVNGVMGHALEFDDVHEKSVMHPAAPVLPAILAVAEREEASGKDLIESVVAGYEVEIRIALSMMPEHYEFWHTTGTCGTFGAAVASGKILGLNKAKMLNALGIAGTQAAGLIDVFGTMSKTLNAGKAAMNGVISALLSEKEFTSSLSILESDKGYCRAASKKFNIQKLTENLGRRFEIMNNIFKRHASCSHMHGAIDAALYLSKKNGIEPKKIREIVVETYPTACKIVGRSYAPKTALEAKFSLPYCVAVSLKCGQVGLSEFSEEKLTDPEISELTKKIKVVRNVDCRDEPLGYATVKICTITGEKYESRVDAPKGFPKNPLTIQEIENKFLQVTSSVLPIERSEEIKHIVLNLHKLDSIKELTALLAGN